MKVKLIATLVLMFPLAVLASTDGGITLTKPNINMSDQASLQRGAKYFMNYCSSCHSLKYMRYEQMAEGIGLTDADGKVDEALVEKNLIFTGAKITDPILTAMPAEEAKQTFGVVPPDLTLVARSRGVDWLYTYFLNFYRDPSRPLGTNNLIFPDVAMPNVFEPLQGVQVPVYKEAMVETAEGVEPDKVIDHLVLEKQGAMSPSEFEQMATDLVNFLHFVGEPHKLERYRVGVWALLFLLLFLIVAYLLKKEYWKDIH